MASSIRGEVILWPVSPVQRPGTTGHRPYQAVIRIANEAGRTVAEVRSGPDGRFEITLEPGTYVLHPESESTYPQARTQTVTVVADHVTPVRITYDSGIR